MCGRIVITTPMEALAALFDAAPDNDLPLGHLPDNDLPLGHLPGGARFNVCPTQTIATVTSEGGIRRLRPMRWGLLPAWYKTPTDGPLLINARSETVAEKPAFRMAVRERRCLIPISGFYEWSPGAAGARLPWYITRADGGVMALGGVWQQWEREGVALLTCAVVTTEAGPQMAAVHNREPVIVEQAVWPLWLGESGKGAALLMKHREPGALAMHRVDPRVNSNRASGAELILPVTA